MVPPTDVIARRPRPSAGAASAPPGAGPPLFSVVVPTYRRPGLLVRAVASVLAQSVRDLECIVVDDASGEALRVPDDPRVRVVVRPVNGGPAAAVNSGVAAARGRYLAFLNDDDLWAPDRLELALAGLAVAPVAVCGSRFLDEPASPIRALDGVVADAILDGITPNLGATALDRRAWQPIDETYPASEDVEWWWRVARAVPVATVACEGLVVRRHGEVRVGHGDAARARASMRMLADGRAWFRAHPRAAAFRWRRVGITARRGGDPALARVAFERSLRVRPAARPGVHLFRAWRSLLDPRGPREPAGVPAPEAAPVPSLRVLQVITDTDRRGAQVFATDLGCALRARGHRVATVALGPGATDVSVPAPVLGRRRWSVSGLLSLRREARRSDIVIAHGSTTLPASALATLGAGVPFVYRQISESLFWAPTPARRGRVRLALAAAARVVALAPSQAAVLTRHFGLPASRVRVVPNAVVPDAFTPADEAQRSAARRSLGVPDGAVVACLGALVPEKGVDLVVEAMAELPAANLVVAGDGPQRSVLERAAARAAPGRVQFTGPLDDPLAVYHAADVVVLASRGGDSMPATLIEAALCEVPVVATPVGAIAETVRDGITGVLVAPDPASIASAVAELLDQPSRARAMGEEARRDALERFSIATVAEAWERVLAEAWVPAPA